MLPQRVGELLEDTPAREILEVDADVAPGEPAAGCVASAVGGVWSDLLYVMARWTIENAAGVHSGVGIIEARCSLVRSLVWVVRAVPASGAGASFSGEWHLRHSR